MANSFRKKFNCGSDNYVFLYADRKHCGKKVKKSWSSENIVDKIKFVICKCFEFGPNHNFAIW